MSRRQFSLFFLAGGIAASVNIGSRVLLGNLMPYALSIVVAYLLGMLTAFTLNRRFVFPGAANPLHQQALWFALINVAALAQTLLVSVGLARWLFPAMGWTWHPETIAHVVGVMVPIVSSYIGHKRLTFRV
jgi:putative flippase GtrA